MSKLDFLTAEDWTERYRASAGGKAASLVAMARAGLDVPPFVVLPTGRTGDEAAVDAAIARAFELSGGEPLCVRSSAQGEDGAEASFAGQLKSVVDVADPEGARAAVAEVVASGRAESVRAYRARMGLEGDARVAVILQVFVPGEVSGVMFTRQRIEAAEGLCEGVVQGTSETSSYVWTSEGFEGQGCLSLGQRARLTELGDELVELFGGPQDVEFTFAGERLVALQSRPVTVALEAPPEEPAYIFDNSNIVESYAGVTTPLTFSYARHAYGVAYRQSCALSGVPASEIEALGPVFDSLLASLDGRVYYNLGNWYRLLSLFPGFEKNAGRMEEMMGVRASARVMAERPPRSRWAGLKMGLKMLRNYLGSRGLVARFQTNFQRVYDDGRGTDWDGLTLPQVKERFEDLRIQLLYRWQAPLVTDFLAMIFFGVLKDLAERWGLDPDERGLVGDLLAGEGGIESTAPTKALLALAERARAAPELARAIRDLDDARGLEQLEAADPDFAGEVRAWLARWGARTMQELKLEVPTLEEDPRFVFRVLKNYLGQPELSLEALEAGERRRRSEAEAEVRARVRGPRRAFFRWVLKEARRHIKNRENMRFARTRAMALVRAVFLRLGRGLADGGALDDGADVFYLEMSEVLGAVDGTTPCGDLRALAAARRAATDAARARPDPADRVKAYGAVTFASLSGELEDLPGALKGTPCSPGVVRAKARVVTDPSDDLALAGEILVAQRTDPGWVPLFPAASGLLVERGSPLSHSAIVARELGLPTIVNIPGLTRAVTDGDEVEMDGGRGTGRKLEEGAE
jgi:pyruvate,water dikinase